MAMATVDAVYYKWVCGSSRLAYWVKRLADAAWSFLFSVREATEF